MRSFVTILLLVTSLLSLSVNDINYFRDNFTGTTDEKKAKTYLDAEIEKASLKEKITINGYKAVVTMRMAEYVSNPFTKLSWFNDGKKMLEESIKMNRNVENIHLRLMVQVNAPSFLGYNKQIEKDRNYILKNLEKSSVPNETKKMILTNLMANDKDGDYQKLAKKYKVV